MVLFRLTTMLISFVLFTAMLLLVGYALIGIGLAVLVVWAVRKVVLTV